MEREPESGDILEQAEEIIKEYKDSSFDRYLWIDPHRAVWKCPLCGAENSFTHLAYCSKCRQ